MILNFVYTLKPLVNTSGLYISLLPYENSENKIISYSMIIHQIFATIITITLNIDIFIQDYSI